MIDLSQNKFQKLLTKSNAGLLAVVVAAAGFAAIGLLTSSNAAAAAPYTETTLMPGDHQTYGVLNVDIDNDGDQDLLLNNHGHEGSGLYLNDGTGHLVDQGHVFKRDPTTPPELDDLDRHDCDVADVDLNGKLDIYCSAGADFGTETKIFPYRTNELLMQQADGSFINKSDVYGVMENTARGRDVAFINANGDAYPDLVMVTDPRTDGKRSQNVVYLNSGGTKFVDKGTGGLPLKGPARCLEKADWNKDGFTDLAYCPLQGGVMLFESNKNGTFKDVTATRGAGSTTTQTWGIEFADLNKDGFADMIRTNVNNVVVRMWNNTSKKFTDGGQSIAQTDARDVAVGNFTNDTIPDLYVMNRGCNNCTPVTNLTDKIYKGNGNGTFTFYADVNANGTGDFVQPWDYNKSGRSVWIVGNGNGPATGSLQLILPTDAVVAAPVVVVKDTTPPTASLLAYKTAVNGLLSGTTNVRPEVGDNIAVDHVTFYLGFSPVYTDYTAPFEWGWDTTTSLNQKYRLQARAFDAAGNFSAPAANPNQVVDMAVNNPPVLPAP